MHDLVHELAQYVSTQECFRFVGDEKSHFLKIPETIRHLSVETKNSEVLRMVGRFKNLRTLHITDEYDSSLVDVLIEIFKENRSIRLLRINHSFELKMMPEEIGYLHHLRYLSFSVFNVNPLPRSLSSFCHLKFIIFDHLEQDIYCYYYFPKDMNQLFNLRYMTYSKLDFPGIGKLKFLQEVKGFSIKNENGYRIEELAHMNDLHHLDITNLQDVRDAEEAYKAKLCDKRKLTHLSLNWGYEKRNIAVRKLDERVLNKLQPHKFLKTLSIYFYMGARSAIWMNKAHLIHNLEQITLSGCRKWKILPPFGQLPFLKSLKLVYMRKVKQLENKFHGNDIMCSVFPSLETLDLYGMEALVDWFDASALFPCLTTLRLYDCPNLQELPYLPPKLESLDIDQIGWKTLNCCSISKSIPPLKSLVVRRCPNITSIFVDGEIGQLEKLIIFDLPSLQSLPSSLTNIIPSLEFVEIEKLPQLQNYPDLPLPFTKTKMKKPTLHPERFGKLDQMNEDRFLEITNLENVRDAQEACNFNLCDKIKLIRLYLDWGLEKRDNVDGDLDERVLDNLQPHIYLKELEIRKYMGARSAIWMNEAHTINNLEKIKLTFCLEWEILPPFGQLPFLKILELWNIPKVKRLENKFHGNDMCCAFPSLERLLLLDMPALVDWFDASVVDNLFPCLIQLNLCICPNLQELPYLPPKLQSLQIEKIGWKTLNCCSISKSIPLKTLQVRDCPNIASISLEGEIAKLKKLTIENLPSLQSFPSSLANFSSLEFLKMANLPLLQEYPDPPPTLKEFYFN